VSFLFINTELLPSSLLKNPSSPAAKLVLDFARAGSGFASSPAAAESGRALDVLLLFQSSMNWYLVVPLAPLPLDSGFLAKGLLPKGILLVLVRRRKPWSTGRRRT
jgi:hypothetical protein